MNYSAKKMNYENAVLISKWKYDSPYDFYNSEESEEYFDELINDNYYSIHNIDEMIGFYCAGSASTVPNEVSKKIYADDDYIDIGFGMRPDLTGKGSGREFVKFIMNSVLKTYPGKKLRLTVADFNKRARRVYEDVGFKYHSEFYFEKSKTQFIIMVRG